MVLGEGGSGLRRHGNLVWTLQNQAISSIGYYLDAQELIDLLESRRSSVFWMFEFRDVDGHNIWVSISFFTTFYYVPITP